MEPSWASGAPWTGTANPTSPLTKEPRSAVGNARRLLHHASVFGHIRDLSRLRQEEPALAYGRLYFREASGNGTDFGLSKGVGGIVSFSRILVDRKILIVANTGSRTFDGSAIVDRDRQCHSPRDESCVQQPKNVFEIASARLPGLTSNRWDLARCGVCPLVAARVRLRPDGRAVAAD